MQFLYPTYLWGFFLILIPIVIHLFQLRKYRLVYFSSLKFLKQLDIEQKRRSRLREILLLISRILLICMLVLAFAHPYFPGKSQQLTSGQTLGIYIDNSMSMENEADGQSLFDHAKKSAIETVQAFSADTRYFLLHNEELFGSRIPLEKKDAISAIELLKLSSRSTDLGTTIQRFRQIIADNGESETAQLNLYSDFQQSYFNPQNVPDSVEFQANLIRLPEGSSNNVFIDSCWFFSPVHKLEKRHTIHARINNLSDQDLNRFPVHLRIQDSLVAQQTVSLAPYSTGELEFSFNIEAGGWQYGKIEIRDYPISFDNLFHFAFYISDKIPVLQIYSAKGNSNLEAVFESDPFFDYSQADAGSIPYQDLRGFKLVLINSLTDLSPNLQDLLKAYVEQGGNLVVIPSETGENQIINRFISTLNAPVFGNLLSRKSEARIPEQMKSFYNQISMNPDQQVEWPVYSQYYRINSKGGQGDVILANETGSPLLTRNTYGNGFISLSAAPFSDDFTNFQIHPLFIPYLYYLANTGVDKQELYYRIGRLEPVQVDIDQSLPKGPVRIKAMDGEFEAIPNQFRDPITGKLSLHLGNYSGSAGILLISRSEGPEAAIAMNYSAEESMVDNLSSSDISKMINEYSWNYISLDEDSGQTEGESENKKRAKAFSLVRVLLLLAMSFLLLESLIHRLKG